MKPVDWIILAVVLIAAGAAVFRIVRRKKRGCACGCDSCPQSGCCLKKDTDKN